MSIYICAQKENVDTVVKQKICTNDYVIEQSSNTEINKGITEIVPRMSMNKYVAVDLSVDFHPNLNTCMLVSKISKSDISKEPNLMAQSNKGLYINALN